MMPVNRNAVASAADLSQLASLSNKLDIMAGTLNSHKVTYIGGAVYHLQEAQQLAENLKNHPNDPQLKQKLNDLEAKVDSLIGKMGKIINAIEVARQTAVFGTSRLVNVPTQVFSAQHRPYTVQVGSQGQVIVTSNKFLDRLNKKLGQGGCGTIYGDSKDGHAVVGKELHNGVPANQLYNEKEMLDGIHASHAGGKVPGIVVAPKAIISRPDQYGKMVMISDKFDGDLFDNTDEQPAYNLPERNRNLFKGFGNMFKALGHIHEKGICHGDIKPENIGVFKSKPNDPYQLFDWGGAVNVREYPPLIPDTTPDYAPHNIHSEVSALALRMTRTTPNSPFFQVDRTRYHQLLVKSDHFALAKSLTLSLLTTATPALEKAMFNMQTNPMNGRAYPTLPINAQKLKEALSKEGYGTEVSDLLIEIFNACDPAKGSVTPQQVEAWGKKFDQLTAATDVIKQFSDRGITYAPNSRMSANHLKQLEKTDSGVVVRPSSQGNKFISIDLKRKNADDIVSIRYELKPDGGFIDHFGREYRDVESIVNYLQSKQISTETTQPKPFNNKDITYKQSFKESEAHLNALPLKESGLVMRPTKDKGFSIDRKLANSNTIVSQNFRVKDGGFIVDGSGNRYPDMDSLMKSLQSKPGAWSQEQQ